MEEKRKSIIVRKICNPTCDYLDIRIDFSNIHKHSPILICECVYRGYNTITLLIIRLNFLRRLLLQIV